MTTSSFGVYVVSWVENTNMTGCISRPLFNNTGRFTNDLNIFLFSLKNTHNHRTWGWRDRLWCWSWSSSCRYPPRPLRCWAWGSSRCSPVWRTERWHCCTLHGQKKVLFKLKGHYHKIFCFRFFSWIIFPQAPENNIRVISTFFWKFSKILASQGAPSVSMTNGGKFATSINATGGVPWATNISANFWKNLKRG